MRYFIIFIILVALVVGISTMCLNRDQIVKLIMFRDFFDVTLPILAFGALVKFLCTGCCTTCSCQRK